MRHIYKGLGKYVRHFSVERSLLEINEAFKVFQDGPVIFNSDSFGIDIPWMDELFEKYSKDLNSHLWYYYDQNLQQKNVLKFYPNIIV